MVGLTPGCLVSWLDGDQERFGVVTELTGNHVTVQFDDLDDVRIFNRAARIARRVELNGSVRRVSTGEVGTIQQLANAEPPRWHVAFADHIATVQERDLRPHVLMDPTSRLRSGMLGSPWQFWLSLTAHRYRIEALNRQLIALAESRVALKPHQVSVVHRVISAYPHRFLLCDEVGLGKTIEAGVILKELRARKSADRALIIVPPNLMRQWQFELKTKFNETFSIINSDTAKVLRQQHGPDVNPFEVVDSAIVSSAWITGKEWSQLVTAVDWDLVVVDEAHHARIRYSGSKVERTHLYRVVESLVAPDSFSKRSALFLTATPMQLDAGEIYGLIEMLDPALFPTLRHFTDHRDKVPGLNALVQDLQIHGFSSARDDGHEIVERVAGWLGEPEPQVEAQLLSGRASVEAVCSRLAERHLLTQVLVRNRKKVVGGFMPRHAHRWEVTLTEPERLALAAVEDYVRNGYRLAGQLTNSQQRSAVGFVMVILQKLMASSLRALRTSLEKRRDKLLSHATTAAAGREVLLTLEQLEQKDAEGETEMDQVLTFLRDVNHAEAAELARLIELLDQVPQDSKAETLVSRLKELEAEQFAPKVLLFTEFRETQEYLKSRLEEELGWNVQLFHGQLKPDAKDAAVDAFRSEQGPAILLSTEAGGEGRNFQFCHLLVNYDLPWNPMRVEQRIGRVDRLGQEHPVQVFNFWIRGTVEERVLDVLEKRIGVFEETVGGLDPILGDTETNLKKIFQLGEKQRDAELAKYEADVERRMAEAREAEEKMRDFIMDARSFSRETVAEVEEESRGLLPTAMETFGLGLLADVNTWVQEQPDLTYRLHFHEPFISDYPQHTRDQSVKRVVTFRPDVATDSQHIEYLTLGHPVIDDLVDRVTQQKYDGCATSAVVPAQEDLPAGNGWLLIQQLTVPGLKDVRELHVTYVDDETGPDDDRARILLDRAATLPSDGVLEPDQLEAAAIATMDEALASASSAAWTRLEHLESDLAKDADARLMREVEKVNSYFDYRDRAASDKLAAAKATLARLEASANPEERRIIPLWTNTVHRHQGLVDRLVQERGEQLAGLHRRRLGAGDVALLGVARIEVREVEPAVEDEGEEVPQP